MPDDRTEGLGRHVAKVTGWRTGRLRQLGYSSYDAYIHGEHWQSVRRTYWAHPFTSKECLCGESDPAKLQLHHKTYLHIGHESVDDLQPLCGQCHNDAHILAARGMIGFDLEGFESEERRQQYAAERRKRLERDGVYLGDYIDDRPFNDFNWRMDAKRRESRDKFELGGKEYRREQARRLKRQARAG